MFDSEVSLVAVRDKVTGGAWINCDVGKTKVPIGGCFSKSKWESAGFSLCAGKSATSVQRLHWPIRAVQVSGT